MNKKIKDELLKGLTFPQQEAVQCINDNLEIVACAGAGKTKTITHRIIYLIANGVKPENIVAITFTRKAAEEMRSRIYSTGEKILGNTQGFAAMYIGTIDSFCLKILQDFASEKYAKYTVLDEVQTKVFLERHPEKTGFKGSVVDTAFNLNHKYDFASRSYYKYESYSKKLDYYAGLMSVLNSSYFDRVYRSRWSEATHNILNNFNSCLNENHFFDFSSLLREMIELLDENSDTNKGIMSEFAKKVYESVKYLIIDEYQDTNPSQEYLVNLFNSHGTKLCVVGDADQAIYQFRGSDETNITNFAKTFNAKTIHLKSNFRSTEAVIKLAEQSIMPKHTGDPDYIPMVPGVIDGRALSYETGDTTWSEFASYDEETDFIVDKIKELNANGVPYSEMAVLFRNRRLLDYGNPVTDYQAELVSKLQSAGIPYIVEGLNQLFTTPEYKASCAIFEYLYEKYSEYQSTDSSGNNIFGYSHQPDENEKESENRENLKNCILQINYNFDDANVDTAISNLSKLDLYKKKYGHECNLQQIFQDFIAALEIDDASEKNGEKLMYNLGKFSKVIADFEQIYFKSSPAFKLGRLHKHLTQVADGLYPEGFEDNVYIRADAVKLMTIHQSKGLEFCAVFIPALTSEVMPSLMSFYRKPDYIYGSIDALEELGSTNDLPYIPNQSNYDATEDSERNVFYVALSRAKKYLFLTYSKNYSYVKTSISPFLEDLKSNSFLKKYDLGLRFTPDCLPVFETVVLPVTLNFSLLSNYFDCPYRFKLSSFYGFVQPFADVQGYGKTMHEIMMHIHRAWIENKTIDDAWIENTVKESMNLPFANEVQINKAILGATECAKAYVRQNEKDSDKIEAAELDINIELGEGVSVNGRIDLVIKGNGPDAKTMIVDLKCSGKDAEQCLNAEQLKIYALGYREMTGTDADYLMIYNLDKPDGSANKQEAVDKEMISASEQNILTAARNIRSSNLPAKAGKSCNNCYMKKLCSEAK